MTPVVAAEMVRIMIDYHTTCRVIRLHGSIFIIPTLIYAVGPRRLVGWTIGMAQ